ncbi:MAG: low temperature requirement protein A [Aeromicrobium sp.]
MAFFAIWWAWLNFAWFNSAYDPDDNLPRLLTLLQIFGSLVRRRCATHLSTRTSRSASSATRSCASAWC